ncbi:MAG: hypothetical protein ACP5G8_08465 [Athalassotoga sp.]
MNITKKVLILTIIGMLALGVFALAGVPVSTGATCSTAKLSVTSNIWVVQGFDATATSYDATFCGATGFLLAGWDAVGIASNGTGGASLSEGTDGGLSSLLKLYGRGPFTGSQYTPFTMDSITNTIANNDLVLAAVTVLSNYNQVSITVGVEGSNITSGPFEALGIVASSWDNSNWSKKEWIPSAPYMQGGTQYSQSGTLGLTMTPINANASPYAGFLFIYTVYKGPNPISNSAQLSNQIAPWVQAGKYPVTFTFTITPTLTL